MYVGVSGQKPDHGFVKDASTQASGIVVPSAAWTKNTLHAIRWTTTPGSASVAIAQLMMDSIRVTKKAIGWSWMRIGFILYTYVAFAAE